MGSSDFSGSEGIGPVCCTRKQYTRHKMRKVQIRVFTKSALQTVCKQFTCLRLFVFVRILSGCGSCLQTQLFVNMFAFMFVY